MLNNWRAMGVCLFAALMLVGSLLGFALWARPAYSQLEKRDLQPFPEFTVESFLDGSFTEGVSLWFADTYPAREALVKLSQNLQGLFGITPEVQLVGGGVQADEIPPEGEGGKKEESSSEQDGKEASSKSRLSTEELVADVQQHLVGNLFVRGDTAYGLYYFNEGGAQAYADAINWIANDLDGQSNVYVMNIPTSGGIMLDEAEYEATGASPQDEANKYFTSLFNDKVKAVDIIPELKKHTDEYLFFRTDHHWTQLGAYYAYLEYCKARDTEPADVLKWRKLESGDMLGSFCSELGYPAEMTANPDTMFGYVPSSTNDLEYEDEAGAVYEANVIIDVSDWGEESKYLGYISGDRPFIRIDNPKRSDGPTCLVIKDSFGNAFVPNIVDDYQTVYVFDFRYTTRNICDFARDNDIDDVLFANSISLATANSVSDSIVALSQY